jgi:hypothetical protein
LAPAPVAAGDGEDSLPQTLPLANVPVLKFKSSPAVPAVAAAPPDPVAARMLSAVATIDPAMRVEQTLAFGRRSAKTPQVASAPARLPRLRVQRGLKLGVEYPIYEGQNLIGRHDDKPVDIDLMDQEPVNLVWASRQHAVVTYENGILTIEDLHSLNGTFVNRHQVFPGQKRMLVANDILQIGTIQLKVTY